MEPAIVCLRKGEERGVRAGAVWIFDNQIDWINDLCTDGGIVEIVDQKERFLARGYFNRKSKITVRILTHDAQESIDRAFFARRMLRMDPDGRYADVLEKVMYNGILSGMSLD